MPQTTFDELLDAIEHLTADEQAELLEVVQRRLADHGRQRVVAEAADAEVEFKSGSIKPATVDDIMREIES